MQEGIFLLLGSNQGQSIANLAEAAHLIEQSGVNIHSRSSLYESAAWGFVQQPDFYNQVLGVASADAPEILMQKLLDIELQMGRIRTVKWGPRKIDIDLLLYGSEIRETHSLRLPHPGIPNRKFTLLPLAEIAGDLVHPVLQKTFNALLQECEDRLWVRKV